jgi:hypothetical protein
VHLVLLEEHHRGRHGRRLGVSLSAFPMKTAMLVIRLLVASHLVLVIPDYAAAAQNSGPYLDAAQFPVGSAPHAVAAGDVDGDGRADLAVANKDSWEVHVLYGDGGGDFAGLQVVALPIKPTDVSLVDLDGDLDLDLIASTYEVPHNVVV